MVEKRYYNKHITICFCRGREREKTRQENGETMCFFVFKLPTFGLHLVVRGCTLISFVRKS